MQTLCYLLHPYEVCCILYVGRCILYVACHSLYVSCKGTMCFCILYVGGCNLYACSECPMWDATSSMSSVASSMWAACALCGLFHPLYGLLQALCWLLQAPCGLLHPLCMMCRCYEGCYIIYVGYCSLHSYFAGAMWAVSSSMTMRAVSSSTRDA